MEPIRNWHSIAVEMMMTDADLALQYVTELFAGDDAEAAASVVRSTRETYDLIQAKRKNLVLSASEAKAIGDKVDRLRARLRLMGEAI